MWNGVEWLDEILLSSDKTVAIIDGSGVLADPAGLNREELVRLAKADPRVKTLLGADPGVAPFLQALAGAGYSI